MAIRFDAPSRPDGEGTRIARVRAWARDLVRPEPADVRRRRIEAEAAAELGLKDGPAQ